MPLAKALKMSRTSFYWHFQDREELLNALIERWRLLNTGNLIQQTNVYAETITEAILNVFDCWVDPKLFDARMDFAIRNWARKKPDLSIVMEQTDRERVEAIRNMFLRFSFSNQQADIRAHTVYYTQVGYISMMVNEEMEERMKKMSAYVETFSGIPPTEKEIARFKARHGDLFRE